jgi:uncharacterized protein (DUF362 family)
MSDVVFLKVKNVSKQSVQDTVQKAMEMGKWDSYVKGKIFIKINSLSDQLVPGQNTSPWVVEKVFSMVRERYPDNEIYAGDADLAADKQLNKAAKLWGNKELAEKYNIKFVNLSEQPFEKVNFNGLAIKEVEVPKILTEVDTILNVPIAKSHCLTMITCCLKNHWGLLPRFRHQFHVVADQAIPDVNFYFKKTVFNLVDGTICMEGNAPRTGIPKICNVIFAGPDRVAIDYTVAKFMGFDADAIKHIENAEKMGIGSRKDVNIVGDAFEVNKFVPPSPGDQPIFKYEMYFRKTPLKPLIFDTPVFGCMCKIATFYNTKWWYGKYGKKYIKEILKSDYKDEFQPILEKNKIKV